MNMISITETAAEHVKKARESQNENDDICLRVAVVSGGCSGSSYQMAFDAPREGDSRIESNGVSIVIDRQSAPMLEGMRIGYQETLQGAGFVLQNPNASQGCGCGKSFAC